MIMSDGPQQLPFLAFVPSSINYLVSVFNVTENHLDLLNSASHEIDSSENLSKT